MTYSKYILIMILVVFLYFVWTGYSEAVNNIITVSLSGKNMWNDSVFFRYSQLLTIDDYNSLYPENTQGPPGPFDSTIVPLLKTMGIPNTVSDTSPSFMFIPDVVAGPTNSIKINNIVYASGVSDYYPELCVSQATASGPASWSVQPQLSVDQSGNNQYKLFDTRICVFCRVDDNSRKFPTDTPFKTLRADVHVCKLQWIDFNNYSVVCLDAEAPKLRAFFESQTELSIRMYLYEGFDINATDTQVRGPTDTASTTSTPNGDTEAASTLDMVNNSNSSIRDALIGINCRDLIQFFGERYTNPDALTSLDLFSGIAPTYKYNMIIAHIIDRFSLSDVAVAPAVPDTAPPAVAVAVAPGAVAPGAVPAVAPLAVPAVAPAVAPAVVAPKNEWVLGILILNNMPSDSNFLTNSIFKDYISKLAEQTIFTHNHLLGSLNVGDQVLQQYITIDISGPGFEDITELTGTHDKLISGFANITNFMDGPVDMNVNVNIIIRDSLILTFHGKNYIRIPDYFHLCSDGKELSGPLTSLTIESNEDIMELVSINSCE